MEESIYKISTIIGVLGSILYILIIISGVPSYDNSYVPELGFVIAISVLIKLFLKPKTFDI